MNLLSLLYLQSLYPTSCMHHPYWSPTVFIVLYIYNYYLYILYVLYLLSAHNQQGGSLCYIFMWFRMLHIVTCHQQSGVSLVNLVFSLWFWAVSVQWGIKAFP